MPTHRSAIDNPLEARIRERAYALWEQEGYLQGRDRLHWDMAAALVAGEVAPAKPKAVKKAPVKAKPKLTAVR